MVDKNHPDIFWRLVRPKKKDVGSIHADIWFWDINNWKVPDNKDCLKIWMLLSKNIDKIGEKVDSAEKFTGEVYFFKGSRSEYIMDSDKDLIQKLFPKAKFIKIQNAGHWLHADNPNDFLSELLSLIWFIAIFHFETCKKNSTFANQFILNENFYNKKK